MRLLLLSSLLAVIVSLAVAMEPGKKAFLPAAPKDPADKAAWLPFIRAYKHTMTRVTDKPLSMDLEAAKLCRLPDPTELPEANPHRGHYVHVYVTPGEEKKIRSGEGTYPVGTLIVKEKLPGPLDSEADSGKKNRASSAFQPELFTVMLKREAGYNKECGDWEFMVVSGDARQVLARGKLDSCVECHKSHAKTDFVTQLYPKK